MSGYSYYRGSAADGVGGRHPADPQPMPATRSHAVWWLALLAVATGPLLAGVVPATVALILAGQFRRESRRSAGFLTGVARVRRGERLAWAGITLAVAGVSVAAAVGLLLVATAPPEPAYPPHVD